VPHVAVTIVMAGAGLVALGLLVPSLRRARTAGDLDASAALTLGMAWLITLPIAVAAMSGGVTRQPDVFGELVLIFPGWYLDAARVAVFVVAALAAVLLLRRLTSVRVPVHTAGLFAILLWAIAHLASGLHGGPLLSFRGGVVLVCLMAATVLPRGRGASLGAGIFGVTLAIASGIQAVFRRDDAFVVPCEEACSGLGFLGVLPNENLLGTALAASIPFAYLGFRGRARYWFILYLAGMAIATGSRTAVLAAVITVVALLIVRPRVDVDRGTPGRAAIAWLVLAGAVFSSVYIIRHDWDPSALSERPALWSVASDYIGESPWFGYGPDAWAGLYASSEIPRDAQRSAHNQWLDVLFVAGWVGAALLVNMIVATLWSSGYARPGVVLALATILMIGTTEGAWSIGTFDLLSFSLVALILTGTTREGETFLATAKDSAARTRRPVGRALPASVGEKLT
jgi:O-antigen ligase